MKAEYENLVAAILTCLSVASFLQLIQLLIPVARPLVLGFLGLYVVTSMVLATKSFYRERRRERFDLSAPTTFDNGVLVLRSKSDRCAAFFAFGFPPRDISADRFRRTLTTLLKVLPHSSILATEFTQQNECYASFYIKLEKSDVLQRSRELFDSILSGLRALFGENDVKPLCDDALLRHLTLGIPARIQWVGRSSRYTALLRTDTGKRWLSAVALTNIQVDLLQAIERESDHNDKTYRVLFSAKSEEQRRVVLSSKLVLITASNRPHSDTPLWGSHPAAIRRMPSSEIIRKLGDLMTRNVVGDYGNYASFEKGADELLSFLGLCKASRSETESTTTQNEMTHSAMAETPKWRKVLTAHAEELGLTFETDGLVWIKGFPLRVDARVGPALFKTVPTCGGDCARLQWLLDQIAVLMETETSSNMVLLLGSPSDAPALSGVLARIPASDRVRLLTSVPQLLEVLREGRVPPRDSD